MKPFFLGGAAALTLAAPAAAQTQAPTPETFYFNCGSGPLTNVSEAPLTWSATKPATAFQGGGGCSSFVYDSFDTAFGGAYAGEVKQLDLTLYGAFSNPAYRALLGASLNVTVTVGGETVFEGAEQGLAEAAGLPGGFKWTLTVPGLDIPASATAKNFVITMTNPWSDDPMVLARGASDMASAITFYDAADLPEPEPEEEF